MIYLDYAANTPVDKDVLNYFYDISIKYYANPNSMHKLGIEAKNIIDNATESIANYFNISKDEIIYTSGSTESNNMVIKGVCERYKNKGKHIILSSLEHNSSIASATIMQDKGFDVDLLPVNKDGIVDINKLKELIRDDTILVSIVSVDSELGIVQPIEEIANLLKNYDNIIFHTDATQAIGKVNINYNNVDLITFTPHKFYGLPGIGILIKKKNVNLIPLINGGKSTTVYRSGTPTTALIASSAKALQIATNNLDERYNHVKKLNEIIINHLKKYDFIHINNTDKSIPYTINFSIKNINSKEFAKILENNEIYISTKTTCCPEKTPSKLVYALTKDKQLASTSLRVSLSHLTTIDEINEFLEIFDKCIGELKQNGKI
jgi:cysteine desulfurase